MKTIYAFDEDKLFSDMYLVDDDHVPTANETFVKPDSSLVMPYHWNGIKWESGTTAEQDAYRDEMPDTVIEPSFERKMIMQNAYSIAQLTAQVMKGATN